MKTAIAIAKYIELKHQCGYEFNGGRKSLQAFSRRIKDTDLCHITQEQVSSYLDESESARLHWLTKHGILLEFFNYWADRGEMPELMMPAKKPRGQQTFVPYIYSRGQIREMLRAVGRCHDTRDFIEVATMKTFMLLLYATGAYTGEVLRLGVDDVDLKQQLLTFREKGARYRVIPIGESLTSVLRKYAEWRARRKYTSCSFLVTKRDQPIQKAIAGGYFEKVRSTAGVVRFDNASYQPRLIDLKCTFAVHRITSWIKNGADLDRMLPALAAYLGQSGLGSTEKYLALTPARFKTHLDKLSPKRRTFHWRNNRDLMKFLSSL